jgi:hypothetical protein
MTKQLNFGFEDEQYGDYGHLFFNIRIVNGIFYYNPISEYFDSMKIEIKYVHELQNLYFALTGEEFKILNKNI